MKENQNKLIIWTASEDFTKPFPQIENLSMSSRAKQKEKSK